MMNASERGELADLLIGGGAQISSNCYAHLKNFIDLLVATRSASGEIGNPCRAAVIKIGRLMRENRDLKSHVPPGTGTTACSVCFRVYPHSEELHAIEAQMLTHLPELGPMENGVPTGHAD